MPCFVAMLVIKHFEQRCYILPDGPLGISVLLLLLCWNIWHKITTSHLLVEGFDIFAG